MSARILPLWAGTRALEAVGRFAYDAWRTGPTAREQREMDATEALDMRTRDLAAEAFDTCDPFAGVADFVFEDERRDELESLALAAIAGNEDDLRAAIGRLRDAFIDAKAEDYVGKVREEDRRDEEDALAARAEW